MSADASNPRRRPRRGSVERPVSTRIYRVSWIPFGLAVLLAAFTVGPAEPLAPPALPPTFDPPTAIQYAAELATSFPDRVAGDTGGSGRGRLDGRSAPRPRDAPRGDLVFRGGAGDGPPVVRQRLRDPARGLAPDDRRHGTSRQHGPVARSQRQRLGDGSAPRDRAERRGPPPGRGRPASAPRSSSSPRTAGRRAGTARPSSPAIPKA